MSNPSTRFVETFQIPSKYDHKDSCFEKGAYGYVFFVDGIATKIFRRDGGMDEEHIRRVFKSEVDAYQRVQDFSELRQITPKFFGPVHFGEILENDKNVPLARTLIFSCAYQMEYIKGSFTKLNTHPKYDDISKLFCKAGIHHLTDASFTEPSSIYEKNTIGIRVVDFAMEEIEAHW